MKARKAVGTRILRYFAAITKAVTYRISQDGILQSKLESFSKDISHSTILENTSQCKAIGYFCKGVPKDGEYNFIEEMKSVAYTKKL